MLDIESLISDFPILDRKVNGQRLVYLDNAATTQKPMPVLMASRHYYEAVNSNIHRGTHFLARLATDAYENARKTVARHLHVLDPREIIFTSGATDSINLVAQSLARSGKIGVGDEILISTLEHHANIVPWQMLCEQTGAILRVVPCAEDGTIDEVAFHQLLGKQTKVLALVWISNSFGVAHPIHRLTAEAKKSGALVLIDAAQAAPHMTMDVPAIGADFLVFSGHKVYANTGIGVLWGRADVLDSLPPWRGGGEMIKEVTFEKTTYNELPFKFEAGTPNIEGAISLAAAFDYLDELGMDEIRQHEANLLEIAAQSLTDSVPGIHLYGPAERTCALSFGIEGIHHYDLGTLIDQMGVAVRTGHHCCQPLMARFGITGTVRASFGIYNTEKDVDALTSSVHKAVSMLR
ncbi:MAG: cysteine desulfurase [Verrucomicrobia bacterium]|nr:MAG: cysteine desulfurase [Verrucomicrobiota bacterium]